MTTMTTVAPMKVDDKTTKIQLVDPNLPAPPEAKYPAKQHARRVASALLAATGGQADTSGPDAGDSRYILLESARTRMNEDNDQAAPFRQRRPFFYLSGCNLPDSFLVYDISNDDLTLFIPPIDSDEVIWSGLPLSVEQALEKYDIDACLSTDNVKSHLSTLHGKIHILADRVTDVDNLLSSSQHVLDTTTLLPAITSCRVVKDDHEIALIKHANAITSHAHANAMRSVRTARNEQELMAAFVGTCIANGGREQAYDCICASGTNAGTLHYVNNDVRLEQSRLNFLIDAGCEYENYCSDVTRTYPLSGRFSAESREIYDLVDEMQQSCMRLIRAGVMWEDVHANAHRVAIRGLLKLGILRSGDTKSVNAATTSIATTAVSPASPIATADPDTTRETQTHQATARERLERELFDSRVSTLFLPHGLGHYLGLDTHDVGGDPDYADKDPMYTYLRIRGRVPENAVLTNEPGIYFCRFIIEPALRDHERYGKYIDSEVLDRYWDVGGVRIEDDVLVTENGCENLTVAPRDWRHVERLIWEGLND